MPIFHPVCHQNIPRYAHAHAHGMPGMASIHWYIAKLIKGRIGSCANLYTGTGIVICPFLSPIWPIFRDRFPLLSTRFPQLSKTGPLDSMGTLTVFFITFPRFEYPDISRSDIYIYIYIYVDYRLKFGSKRLKNGWKRPKTPEIPSIDPPGVLINTQ